MNPAVIGVFVPIVAIVGGIAVAIASILSKTRLRELQIRERIAMIEKGLVPPPEADPGGFDRAMDRFDRHDRFGGFGRHHGGRHRRAGITLVGVGLGLMVLIGFAGNEPGSAVGVGGFLVVMGLAFLINSFFERPDTPMSTTPTKPGDPDASPGAGS